MIKEVKTPFIFPGQIGWSPAETRTVWHRINNPNFKIKRKFKGRWNTEEHGAIKSKMWAPGQIRTGSINTKVPSEEHIIRTGEKPIPFEKYIDSPEKLLSSMRTFRKADSGREFMMKYLKSLQWVKRASKHMSKQEAQKLGKFESQLIDLMNPPKGFKPVYTKLKFLGNGTIGESYVPYNAKEYNREIRIDPNTKVDLKYTGVHEAAHASTLNYTPVKEKEHFKELFPEELQPLLDKQLANAKKLADQLEIDPKRYKKYIDVIAEKRNLSTQDAKDLIDNWISYLKDPGEARARGLAAVAYGRTKDIPREVDEGQNVFTKESLDNLYKNIFSIGVPIGVGLYATQN